MKTEIFDEIIVNDKGESTVSGSLAHRLYYDNHMDGRSMLGFCGISTRGKAARVLQWINDSWVEKGKCYDLNHARDLCKMLCNAGRDNLLIVARQKEGGAKCA